MLQNLQQGDITLAAAPATTIPNQLQMPVEQLNPYSAHTDKKSSLAEVTASFIIMLNSKSSNVQMS